MPRSSAQRSNEAATGLLGGGSWTSQVCMPGSIDEQMFGHQWYQPVNLHSLLNPCPSTRHRPSSSTTLVTRDPRGHRISSRSALTLHWLRHPTATIVRQLVLLLALYYPTASYYSPIAIAVARTLLTRIQFINTAASTMRAVCCGSG